MPNKLKNFTTQAFLFTLLLSFPLIAVSQGGDEEEQEGTQEREQKKKMRSKKDREPDVEVSESEMKKVVSLHQKVRPIQMKTQKTMMKNLKDSDLERQRFTEIRRAEKSGQNPDMTEEEKKALQELEKKNKKARKEMKGKVKTKVENGGMKWKRFQKLSRAVQKYPKLRERYRKRMKKASGGDKKMSDPKKGRGSKK